MEGKGRGGREGAGIKGKVGPSLFGSKLRPCELRTPGVKSAIYDCLVTVASLPPPSASLMSVSCRWQCLKVTGSHVQ